MIYSMYIPKKKSILSLALLLATQAALATSSKELLAQTKHFRIYADSSIKNKITQDDLIFLKNYLEEAYSALQAELGVDAASSVVESLTLFYRQTLEERSLQYVLLA